MKGSPLLEPFAIRIRPRSCQNLRARCGRDVARDREIEIRARAPRPAPLLRASSVFGIENEGGAGGAVVFVVVALGTALTLFGLGLVMAATGLLVP